ncbi:hypothetical protein [Methylocystis heyeri]|uniref:Uncharacterized protein n=1 Tax=Methylocystis heyeri TaxID=391905 RepID=A0A6B8KEE1_9HYPH|nr:hypothetical protein [Methylocystis heyeri]QGM44938.1 hypothetical protein H2LOC_004130 [Methylocystis heyeri]
MANKNIVRLLEAKFSESQRDLRSAVIDFGISDEKLLELRAAVRRAEQDLQDAKKKKGILGVLGL